MPGEQLSVAAKNCGCMAAELYTLAPCQIDVVYIWIVPFISAVQNPGYLGPPRECPL